MKPSHHHYEGGFSTSTFASSLNPNPNTRI